MWDEILKAFITLFVIMDPFASMPIFLNLTKGLPRKEVAENATNAITVAAVLLFIFLFFGVGILNVFKININSFIIAGGLILLIIGIQYVLGLKFRKEKVKEYDVASVPIGTPLITGPGVITTVIILVNEFGYVVAMSAAIASLLLTWLFLFYSTKIYKIIGEHWSKVLSRVMGLLVAAIAVEFIKNGILGIMSLI
jgi:multiple antibiotic resistance protein